MWNILENIWIYVPRNVVFDQILFFEFEITAFDIEIGASMVIPIVRLGRFQWIEHYITFIPITLHVKIFGHHFEIFVLFPLSF